MTRSPAPGNPSAEPVAEVALPRPLLRTFRYRVPEGLLPAARPGVRVRVPFGRGRSIGIIDHLTNPRQAAPQPDDAAERPDLRDIEAVLDPEPLLPAALLELCRQVADYYVAPLGLVLRTALPPGLLGPTGHAELTDRVRQVIRISRPLPTLVAREEAFGRAKRQREAYEMLESLGGSAAVAHLESQLGFSRAVLRGLEKRRLAEIRDEAAPRDPGAVLGAGLGSWSPDHERSDPPPPTPAQTAVLEQLGARLDGEAPGVVLLHGVTGSGKTLVYLQLLELVMARGRSAIVLVPEIALTPQTASRFRSTFGDRVALLHSGLSDGERQEEWKALREGRKRIALGPRSAVFAPVIDLGVIVVDEEHESSYKQSDTPRYHARAVAALRCQIEDALCLLGSATPSLESWAHVRAGRYELCTLPDRATPHPLPRVEVIDLRSEREAAAGTKPAGTRAAPPTPGPTVLSDQLRSALADRLERGEQAMLLLNRRGYSTFVQCPNCGHVWSCPNCNVSLTYHRRRDRVVCHHCAFEERRPQGCTECGGEDLMFTGLGTEQVERRVGEEFPAARIARMDVDTTSRKWSHAAILERVRRHEVDVLVGTQMIAKGLDLPGITLVGVINADVGLNLPDFRASERTFQLVAQVAGRAGRGARPGRVIVQTFRPHHFALRAAAGHDYVAFAERELEDRRGPRYPPHRRLANLVISGPTESAVADEAVDLARWTRGLIEDRRLELELVGPAPCPIDRVRERWRWHFLLKADHAGRLGAALRYIASHRGQLRRRMRLEIDRDPEALL